MFLLNRHYFLAVLCLLPFAAWGQAAPTLTVGSASAQAGTTVTLPVIFDPATASVPSMQFDLTLPAALSTGAVTVGTNLTNADKNVNAQLINGNTWRFIVVGFNQTPIASGGLLSVRVAIAPGTAGGTLNIPVSGIIYSDSNAMSIAGGTSTGGAITVGDAGAPILVNTNLGAVQVYPNPWRGDKHQGIDVAFNNLSANSTIKIFTLSGHYLKTIPTNGATATWDLTNDSGTKAASGIYLYLITDGQGDKVYGKLAVIK